MRILISTGEVSGDLQGSLLVQALRQQASQQGRDLDIVALGGERMAEVGANLLANTAAIGSVGLTESLRFILPTWQIQQRIKRYLRENPVDGLILIDYMGPNLAIGAYVRRQWPDLPILYYISPQAWIWSPTGRETQQILKITDRLLAIFPDEAKFFAEKGLPVTWVGHPLLDRIAQAPSRAEARQQLGFSPEQLVVTLLPASRVQELHSLLPIICAAAQKLQSQFPQIQFCLPISLPTYRDRITAVLQDYGLNSRLLEGQTLAAIASADLAITKSGTVNLEIALLNVPQVVLYRVSPLTMWVARRVLKFDLPFVSPVNIVMNQAMVPELLQEAATPERIFAEALALLQNAERRQETLAHYQTLRQSLGTPGVCQRAAQEILAYIITRRAATDCDIP